MSSPGGVHDVVKEWIASSNDWKSAAKEKLVNAFKAARGMKTFCVQLPAGIEYSEYIHFVMDEFGKDIPVYLASDGQVRFAISKDELRRAHENSHAHYSPHNAEMYG